MKNGGYFCLIWILHRCLVLGLNLVEFWMHGLFWIWLNLQVSLEFDSGEYGDWWVLEFSGVLVIIFG